ncbi:NAD-dependent epimerase/dehydratase family protein [Spirochaetia bacterium 38H-sp]|uniref:NAD-dependent epimerase/dehydratase family protein n=1 Tax=Rarispira pelagica TaxID=3141764 RepID=A0ABU9U9N7_9SPIR
MRVLFIGGTGNISYYCTLEAVKQGLDVVLVTRGKTGIRPIPSSVKIIKADVNDTEFVLTELKRQNINIDVLVDWVAFTVSDVKRDMLLCSKLGASYFFISSASIYKKPPISPIITEETPVSNPYWKYSQDKIEAEDFVRREFPKLGLRYTIIRPSHTIGEGWLPTSLGSTGFTVASRILEDKEIVIHDDGNAFWTLTHSEDFAKGFVPLLYLDYDFDTFNITSGFFYSWNTIHNVIAKTLGKKLLPVYVKSSHIAMLDKDKGASLIGDKAYTTLFDMSRLKSVVKNFSPVIGLEEMIARSIKWYEDNPQSRKKDQYVNYLYDRIIEIQKKADSLWVKTEV